MITTDENGVNMFINLIALRVEDIARVENDEDEDTVITYHNGDTISFRLDKEGHTTLLESIQKRYLRMIEAGIIKCVIVDSVKGLSKLSHSAPVGEGNERSIKVE